LFSGQRWRAPDAHERRNGRETTDLGMHGKLCRAAARPEVHRCRS
jgi:hypothetical protein